MGDAAADFAALMSGAASQAAPDPAEAPYGYTRDRATGELRPKKVPGRPRGAPPPSVEELKAAHEGDGSPDAPGAAAPPAEDRAPDEKKRRGRAGPATPDSDSTPAYVPGRIAKGMNRLYRRAGKIVKAFDPMVGEALIEVTRKDDDEDLTVGDAWEELARVNPRIRRFLNRLISGGAYGQLVAAHGPIILALLMKPAVLNRIPFGRLIEALAERDEEMQAVRDEFAAEQQAADQADRLFEGLAPQDLSQMATLAQGVAAGFRSRGATQAPGAVFQEAA